MTRSLLAVCFGFLMACGGSHPNTKTGSGSATEAEACAPTDCGPEPPLASAVCPEGAAISTECQRATTGACQRKILCDGKERTDTNDASDAGAPAPAQP